LETNTSKGEMFVDPTCLDVEEINQLYRTTVREDDYVNPNADVVLRWRSITSCASDWIIGNNNYMKFPQVGAQE
jgi:hypothetical protein